MRRRRLLVYTSCLLQNLFGPCLHTCDMKQVVIFIIDPHTHQHLVFIMDASFVPVKSTGTKWDCKGFTEAYKIDYFDPLTKDLTKLYLGSFLIGSHWLSIMIGDFKHMT